MTARGNERRAIFRGDGDYVPTVLILEDGLLARASSRRDDPCTTGTEIGRRRFRRRPAGPEVIRIKDGKGRETEDKNSRTGRTNVKC
jgi:hypothetical protein